MQPEKPEGAVRTPERVAIEIAVRLVLLGIFAWVALMLLRPFLPILLWSAVLTIAFYPIYEWLRDRLGGRSWLAALCLTLFGVAMTAGPTTVLLASLVRSVEDAGPPPRDAADHSCRRCRTRSARLPVVGPPLASFWDAAACELRGLLRPLRPLSGGPGRMGAAPRDRARGQPRRHLRGGHRLGASSTRRRRG